MVSDIAVNKDSVIVSINPKIYPLEVIYSAAYVFLDRAYILLDGEPQSKITVELKPKKKPVDREELEKLGGDFNNELINYADYRKRAERTAKLRELILQRALLTNSQLEEEDYESDGSIEDLENEEKNDFLEDPEGIAIPWEEKYGKESKECSK
jgi:His-Xaa-Ser system protein HxsD